MHAQRGNAVVLFTLCCVIGLTSISGIAAVGSRIVRNTNVQNGADAVALGLLLGGAAGAQRVATANSVTIDRIEQSPSEVRVWVRSGDATASATADFGG
ncbi:MAG: hypothetical protein EXQ63_05405 [Ilumatobacteraceae bacterium]|nr:hypothetical protein [Ilumatobacteraceae bacterium]